MRSILCPLDITEPLDDRIETALALARACDGHVTFQIATPFAQMASWEPFGGAAVSAYALKEARDANDRLAGELDKRFASQDVPFDIEVLDQERITAAAAAARFADIVVGSLADPTIEEMALGLRAPVLGVPRGLPMLTFRQACADRVGRWPRRRQCHARRLAISANGQRSPPAHRA